MALFTNGFRSVQIADDEEFVVQKHFAGKIVVLSEALTLSPYVKKLKYQNFEVYLLFNSHYSSAMVQTL